MEPERDTKFVRNLGELFMRGVSGTILGGRHWRVDAQSVGDAEGPV